MADTVLTTAVSSLSDDNNALWGPFWIGPTTGAVIMLDNADDVSAFKTTNGTSYSDAGPAEAGTARALHAFFDRETPNDTTGNLVHCVWLDEIADDFQYANYDISGESWSTPVTIEATLTVDANDIDNVTFIGKARSGLLLAGYRTTGGSAMYYSDDGGATWNSRTADPFAARDIVTAHPANTGDDDDMCIFHLPQAGGNFSAKMYDHSGDSLTTTVLDTGLNANTKYVRQWSVATSQWDQRIYIVYRNHSDNAGMDIESGTLAPNSIDSPAFVQKAEAVTNIAESSQIALCFDQPGNKIYFAYLKGGGWQSSTTAVYHVSTDGMDSWGAEQAMSETSDDHRIISAGGNVGASGGRFQPVWYNDDLVRHLFNAGNDVEIAAGLVGAGGLAAGHHLRMRKRHQTLRSGRAL